MKRILVISVIIAFVLIGAFASVSYIYDQIQRERYKKIWAENIKTENQIRDLFAPILSNLTFVLDGDSYSFIVEDACLWHGKEGLNRLEDDVNIRFIVLRNGEPITNLTDSGHIISKVKRDALNSNFYRYNSNYPKTKNEPYSDIAKIFREFINIFYEFSTSKSQRASGMMEHEYYDESKVEYDELGNIVKEGEVSYLIEKSHSNQSQTIEFSTKFILKPTGEKMNIVISRIEKKPVKVVKPNTSVAPTFPNNTNKD